MEESLSGNVSLYLESLSSHVLETLYIQPSSCLSVFRFDFVATNARLLPQLAKQYVLRLLYLSKPYPVKNILRWSEKESNSANTVYFADLTDNNLDGF